MEIKSYRKLRLISLSIAFTIILVNPILNYFWQINFIQGWYQSIAIGKLWFVSPLEGLEAIIISKTVYTPLIIAMLIPITVAFLLGRVFCSWICPISFLSEVYDIIYRKISKKERTRDSWKIPKRTLWFSLTGELLISMILAAPIFVFLSPPGLVGREIMMLTFFKRFALEGIVIVAVIILHIKTRRFFCRYLCPLGALLAIIGAKRKLIVIRKTEKCNQCKLCNSICPMDIKPSNYSTEKPDIYCWNCGECVDICRKKALSFRWRS